MNEQAQGLYDKDRYYDSDGRASRLAPSLNALLWLLDRQKAKSTARAYRRRGGVQNPNATKRVLDIGAGDGKFLHFMREFGFEPEGTTASAISQEAALKHFRVKLEHTKEIPERIRQLKFDILTYWHVFEHLEDPEAHVRLWPELLAPGGLIVVEVPNVESLGARMAFDSWLGSDVTHHVNLMPRAEIESLLGRHGLRIVDATEFSLKFTYPFLWSALLGRAFGTRTYDFDRIFNTLQDPLGSLRGSPLLTLNALASVTYLTPAIGACAVAGLLLNRGEVLRLYIQPSAR